MNILIVGAGFAGSVCARELAEVGHQILVVDRRDHIAGNAYDVKDEHGILIHQYGPHIFHTNSKRIFNYLSKYTEWHYYEHRVRGVVNGKEYPFPINRDTLNQLYNLDLDEKGAADFFEKVREPKEQVRTSEDVVLNSVGRDLYEKFFLNYTKKQWGIDPSQLKAGVAARIPTRTNSDDRYFTDTYQVMPLHGYTAMFENLLNHPNITVCLSTEYKEVLNENDTFDHLVYTGPIDAFYDYKFGHLPYRSLRFEHQYLENIEQYQSVGTVNYPNDFDFTRITEFKHLTGQKHPSTSIVREYPTDIGDPYYPIPRDENEQLFKKYQALANAEENVTFVGRLAEYRYYNMDQVVGAALNAVEKILGKLN
ncbi:UDP-galactopyranose mutase [Acinetobacter sp. C_4_1]|uniref:UDP-galactopyranose mutase n=1 Tax=unclassified Acinetobacter TaxID=196816 RepID=UPI0021B83154|nr:MULTISPECIES: UDP-galactopyranose mutase [unclassified Acinetobacter]MCT8089477.1 UDP-galactopyranose mutase [Acinetobacter sp. F_3_1]MCT8098155.1 UDP-galactopyranose mutase [Acinetobacter sp. C_3_1]MCT8101071.1 UDP-galactopyranose mutase [Acinetobacter sp. C_4_1]MCT8134822.1 UDP-galactopyranose mutase [Acinetobacter sp. T_3_1]